MPDLQTITYLVSLALLIGASVYLNDRRAFLFTIVIASQWCETTMWYLLTGDDAPWWFNFTVNICAGWLTALYVTPPDRRSVIWSGSFAVLATFDISSLGISPARYWDGLWLLSWLQLALIGAGVAYEDIARRSGVDDPVHLSRVFSWRMVRRNEKDG